MRFRTEFEMEREIRGLKRQLKAMQSVTTRRERAREREGDAPPMREDEAISTALRILGAERDSMITHYDGSTYRIVVRDCIGQEIVGAGASPEGAARRLLAHAEGAAGSRAQALFDDPLARSWCLQKEIAAHFRLKTQALREMMKLTPAGVRRPWVDVGTRGADTVVMKNLRWESIQTAEAWLREVCRAEPDDG